LQFQRIVISVIILIFTFFSVIPAYSQNASNTGVPLNPDRIQIVIQNGTSESSEQRTVSLYTNIATAAGAAGGAIGGAIAGSVLTTRHARKLEERKETSAKLEETRFNEGMLEVVQNELQTASEFRDLCSKSFAEESDTEAMQIIRAAINYPREYLKISIERRVRIFGPGITKDLEFSYILYVTFLHLLGRNFEDSTLADIKERLTNTNPKRIKDEIDNVIKSVENRHNEIRKSYENTPRK
jgi:hypothetical protein